MDELNLYMPIVRQLITSICSMLAAYGYVAGSMTEIYTALAVGSFNLMWMLIVQYRKNMKVHELKAEVKDVKAEVRELKNGQENT